MKITEEAFKAIKHFLENEDSEKVFRLSVQTGGCSGFSYSTEIGLSSDEDIVLGDRISTDKISYDYIQNITLDYKDTLAFSGFTFTNPDAKGTCGCGISFDI